MTPSMLDRRRLVFLDIETTGLDPYRNPIWEIAAICYGVPGPHLWQQAVPADMPVFADDDEVPEYVNQYMSRWTLDNSRFKERYNDEDSLPPAMSALMLVEILQYVANTGAGRPVIVGAVPSFDMMRLELLLREFGYPIYDSPKPDWMWDHHLIDVEQLAAGALIARGYPLPEKWSLSTFAECFDVPALAEGERHTALGDALLAQALFERITDSQTSDHAKFKQSVGGVLANDENRLCS